MNADQLQDLAQHVDRELNPEGDRQIGFALIVFQFNAPGISQYISTGERSTMIEALKETVERLENREDNPR